MEEERVVAQPKRRGFSARLIAAGAIVLLYLMVAIYIIRVIIADGVLDEGQWEQVMVLFSGIVTLATTAAGVLLGVEVQQSNVEAANERAAKSQIEAQDAAERTGKIKQKVEEIDKKVRQAKTGTGGGAAVSPQVLDDIETELTQVMTY